MDAVANFNSKAPGIVAKLLGDFPEQRWDGACAITGNGGYESAGFTTLQETDPVVKGSRGGWGWFQWTGPRRRAFEAYCKRNGLDPAGDKANYAWLFVELKSSEKGALAKTAAAQGLFAKVRAFEQAFLRAGVKNYPAREEWAVRARDAWQAAGRPVAGTPPGEQVATLRDEAEATDARSSDAVKKAAASAGGGAIVDGGAALNHADWLLLGGFGLFVLVIVFMFVWLAQQHGQRADDLDDAADRIAELNEVEAI